jgi:hypothetical protein
VTVNGGEKFCQKGNRGISHSEMIHHTGVELYNIPIENNIREFIGSNIVRSTDSMIVKVIIPKARGKKDVTQEELDAFQSGEEEKFGKAMSYTAALFQGIHESHRIGDFVNKFEFLCFHHSILNFNLKFNLKSHISLHIIIPWNQNLKISKSPNLQSSQSN